MVNEAINNLKSDRENTMLAKFLFKVHPAPMAFTQRYGSQSLPRIKYIYYIICN